MHKTVTVSSLLAEEKWRFDIRYGNLRTGLDLKSLLSWRADLYRLFYLSGKATVVYPYGSSLSSASAPGATWAVAFDRADIGPALHQSLKLIAERNARRLIVDVPANERCHWEDRFRYLLSVGDRSAEQDAIRAVLRSCLSDFFRLLRSGVLFEVPDFDTITSVLSFIEKHFQEPITLRNVAEATNFSPAYLTDLMRRRTSFPIHSWIVRYRLAAAKRLLDETAMPVSSVAQAVGFGDSSHFCKQFGRVIGLTPAVWRSRQRSQRLTATRQDAILRTAWPADPAQLRAIIDAIPQMVWAKTEDGSLLYANRRWYEYTGFTVEESVGHGWLRAVHPDDVHRCLASWASAQAMSGDLRYEARLRRAIDSRYRSHLIHNVARRSGADIRWFGTATDVQGSRENVLN